MTIAELFVNLGVKGAGETGKALTGVKDKLGEIGESSLAAKAAIIGVVIGLERLTGFASQAGMELNKFSVLTGGSTQELQKWQYALGRFDVAGEETQSTLTSLQAQMAQMKLTGQAPAGLNFLANTVGFDPKKADDMFYVMGQLQKLVKTQPPAIANQIAKSFGLSENMIQGLRLMNLEVDKLSKKNIISDDEIKRLTEINKAWKDFWFTLKTMGIKFVASEGMQGIKMLMGAFNFIAGLIGQVQKLTDKFAILGTVLKSIAFIILAVFAPVTATILGVIALLAKLEENKNKKPEQLKQEAHEMVNQNKNMSFGYNKDNIFAKGYDFVKGLFGPNKEGSPNPNVAPNVAGPDNKTAAYNVNNVFNIDGSNSSPKDIANESSSMIDKTFRQMAAQKGGQ